MASTTRRSAHPSGRVPGRIDRERRRRRLALSLQSLEGRLLLSNTYTVTSTLDDGSVGSLRWAIGQVDEDTGGGTDTIDFHIGGTGPFVIQPASPLPVITTPVLIDGYSQPGSSRNTKSTSDNAVLQVVLNGSQSFFQTGLEIAAPGSTVQGLDIENCYNGILIDQGGSATIRGDFIGTDATGNFSVYNYFGVTVNSSTASTVGGTTPAARDLIAGNLIDQVEIGYQSAAIVEGNFVGVGASGSAVVGGGSATGVYAGGNSAGTIIGGAATGAGNVIVGSSGVQLDGGAVVEGNLIGTDATGTVALNGSGTGIQVSGTGNTIGGTAPGEGNLISGNGYGGISVSSGTQNLIQGNRIGTDISGTLPLGNGGDGVSIQYGASQTTVGGLATGAGNVIAYNGLNGVTVGAYSTDNSQENAILSNSIFANARLGIDLGNDGVTSNIPGGNPIAPNRSEPYPVVGVAVGFSTGASVGGTLADLPNTAYTLQFFSDPTADPSGHGQGRTLLGTTTVTTDASGNAVIAAHFPGVVLPAGLAVSATATDPNGNTSEFSADVTSIVSTSPVYAVNDLYNTDVNTTLVVPPAAGVQANDLSANGLPYVSKVVTGPAHGTLALNKDGSFSYKPVAGYTGADTFTYRDSEPGGRSNVATVTIDVNPKTLVVTNTNDGGPGSFRAAILIADGSNSPGPDTIDFDIPNNGPFVITPVTALPAVSRPTIIDGYSQPGAYPNTLAVGDNAILQVQLQGPTNSYVTFDGLDITGGGSTVRGLAIGGFNNYSIQTSAIAVSGPGGDVFQGDFFGTLADGATPAPGYFDLKISGSDANVVGGADPASRDIISGANFAQVFVAAGSTGNLIEGDYIGTNRTGAAATLGGSSFAGVFLQDAPGNTIGGDVAGAGDVISGNQTGIYLAAGTTAAGSTGTVIQGNIIGLDATGSSAVSQYQGVIIDAGADSLIGGVDTLARNLISGNQQAGISIQAQSDAASTSGEMIWGNYIGTEARGLGAVGNGVGISISGATGDLIGGTAPGEGNLISGNNGPGIEDQNSQATPGGNTIQGNRIGTDSNGTRPLGNGRSVYGITAGIYLSGSADQIGGTAPGSANVISGNLGDGILIDSANGNTIAGNFIGTDASGAVALGDGGDGVSIVNASSNNAVGGLAMGAGNVIAYNGGNGVTVGSSSFDDETGNSILSNSIHDNVKLGIDLGGDGVTLDTPGSPHVGPNDLQNFPVIVSAIDFNGAITVRGTLSSTPSTTFTVQFFTSAAPDQSGHGEGESPLGTIAVTTDATGFAAFQLSFTPRPGASLSATATDPGGNTSEFAADFAVATATSPLAAYDDAYRVDTGSTLTVAAPGVLANDIDAYGNLFTARLVSMPSHGTVTLNADGSFSYTPVAHYLGNDSFTYRDSGVDGTSNVATVTLAVVPKVFVVTNTNDDGPGSLRLAIEDADLASSAAPDTIRFAIPGTGPFTISPLTPLPAVTHATIIDGDTQKGSSANTLAVGDNAVILIRIDGSKLTYNIANNYGLCLVGGGSTARGLDVTDFGIGIYLSGGSGDVIQGDFIGTDTTGSVGGNGIGNGEGIGDDQSSSPIIGGATPASRDIISGNNGNGINLNGTAGTAFGGAIQGDYIGTDVTGTKPLGNAYQGALLIDTAGLLIGGTIAGDGNLISANFNCGILIGGPGSTAILIQGNIIGTDVTGANRLGNSYQGIYAGFWGDPDHYGSASDITIGGTSAAARNLISGNENNGIWISGQGANNDVVEGNRIGTDINGSYAIPNSFDGVQIANGAEGNLVGGTAYGAGNLLSGNGLSGGSAFAGAVNNTFQGNLVGTDATGEKPLGNSAEGIFIGGSGNLVGGTVAAARNVISANAQYGVWIEAGTGDAVEGNYIGTDKAATAPLGNASDGVSIRDGSTNNTVGGTAAGAGNVIAANGPIDLGSGIAIVNASDNNSVQGNLIGTDRTGKVALGNTSDGIYTDSNGNQIGGTTAGAGNVIATNGKYGIEINADAATNVVQGNDIGTDKSGTRTLGNAFDGVLIDNGSSGNVVGGLAAGAGNVIAHNGGNGVTVGSGATDASIDDSILSDSIHDNVGLGIDLGDDGVTPDGSGIVPNLGQNYPVLATVATVGGVTTVTGTLVGVASTTYTIQFFANTAPDPSGYGEGQTLVETVAITTDASGHAAFSVALSTAVPLGRSVSATATDPLGDTSEFSADVTVTNGRASVPHSGPRMTATVARSGFEADLAALAADVSSTRPPAVGARSATVAAPAVRAVARVVAQGSAPLRPVDPLARVGASPV